MRAEIARRLVRCASWPIDRSYWHGQCRNRPRLERLYTVLGRPVTRALLRQAVAIDRKAAGQQMAEECWWG